jgi:phosphoenolpyruvate synthase/pyruvate phosphate dikinase
MFTLDPESGFPEAVVVSAAWGLGETVVSGQVDPDEYLVFKPLLKDEGLNPVLAHSVGAKRRKAVYADEGPTRTVDTTARERASRVLDDAEVRALARWAVAVEEHYGCPSLCGQRPSNDPEFTRFLVGAGIDSVSVTPDSFAAVKQHVAAAEAALGG